MQVAVSIVGEGRIAGLGVLIEVVGDVIVGSAIVGHREAIAGGVVAVLDVAAVGQSDAGQLAIGVVVVMGVAVQCRDIGATPHRVVAVVEARVDRAIGLEINQVGE
ncbi:hypothetical protein D3C76_1654450 [compost metagenome]